MPQGGMTTNGSDERARTCSARPDNAAEGQEAAENRARSQDLVEKPDAPENCQNRREVGECGDLGGVEPAQGEILKRQVQRRGQEGEYRQANPNTVEIGASPSLLLPWVCSRPRQHGGCDSYAARTMFVSGR